MVSVLIMSAGASSRMDGIDKQTLMLCGQSVLRRSVEAFFGIPEVCEILVVVNPEMASLYQRLFEGMESSGVPVRVVAKGGKTRQESVFGGMEEVALKASFVAIHDGARPLISKDDIRRVFEDAKVYGAAILGTRVTDTIKLAEKGTILKTADRTNLFKAQTPQVFRVLDYKKAMATALQQGVFFTDDAQLFEHTGRAVHLTEGSRENLKITTPEDIPLAEAILRRREPAHRPLFRVGQGYDVHRLTPGRKLILGGVEIPWEKGLLGHSDADVLLHAIMDALLGGASLGDIGKHFPDRDPAYAGCDSRVLLRRVGQLVHEKGYQIQNLDATVIAQAPKIGPHINRMRETIAEDLGLCYDVVNVKATTEEGLGFTGDGSGIASSAVCLLCQAI